MRVAVIVPWRSGCPHRERALDWVTEQFGAHHPDWPIIVSEHDDGEWCKAAAVDHGLNRTYADVLVIHDADVWVPNLAETVDNCTSWAVPHTLVHRLDEHATDQIIETGTPGEGRARRPYRGFAGGGITVVRRHVYEDAPLDRRFLGWGQEDASWAAALGCLYGPPWRGAADLWHLWHPPQPRVSYSVGSRQGEALYRRYRSAGGSPERMRQLIDEGRGTCPAT